ncbi:3-hydroxyacyl-CoA dehydrogenase family protein [Arthrobacter sp. MMS18-M83]|uniref:3-hydroxyacyl-CoA dehydrogenase family protein n=1 Tax=Arthrobacter sp. MMS18-M83 TaxID=2996261 RepID=UPI00227D5093|nr:3-hydroxyacyl-CoA dehydrogenase family protein [Arthrobacter sp. MMS18-M83]WAH97692.1 3-hydroxyacyl-CoA dehydrogenase family protein [Arthrobacter sp. MMS18-M83]
MQIKRVAVVGCGTMGGGIVQTAAQNGFQTVGVETSEQAAEAARARIAAGLNRSFTRGKITEAQRDSALANFTVSSDLSDITDADLVIEAVFEDVELKKEILGRIDKLVAPEAFIASNTSTIPLVILAAATTRPEQVVGAHFFNPVPSMKLVEVIKTPVTLPENVQTFVDFAKALGKSPVVVNDVPGFIGNLLIVPYLTDAIRAFERGVADMESIDEVIKLGFNHPMGPFALSDLIGLDIVHDMAASMYEEYKDPRYFPPTLLKQYVRLGWLGRKTGRGFYTYDENGARS